jgi:hypothetical protein
MMERHKYRNSTISGAMEKSAPVITSGYSGWSEPALVAVEFHTANPSVNGKSAA